MGRGLHYNIRSGKSYFLTLTVVDWIDLFTRIGQKKLIIDSLRYCIQNKGLRVFGWCLMPSHLHLIANAREGKELSDIIRDFKRHTSKNSIILIENEPESRREWLLDRFEFAGRIHPKNKNYKVWQDKNHAIELFTEKVTWQKLRYIHRNPVVDEIVAREEDYLYSSARNYCGLSSKLAIELLTTPVITTSDRNFLNI